MFSVIYCLFPVLLIPISIYLSQKRKSLSWEIKKGKICYHCKEDINLSDDILMSRIMMNKDYKKLCTKCSRDIKIDSIKNPIIFLKYKFDKYLISKKSDELNWYFAGSVFMLITVDIILTICGYKIGLYLLYGTLNIIFWIISIYKIIYTTQKKVSD